MTPLSPNQSSVPHKSKKPKKFYPPRPTVWMVRLVQALSTAIARYIYKLELEVAPADLERLRALRDERLLMFPNHPTFREPVLLYVLSDRVRLPFYYLAAYELFASPMGKVFQAIGVYSIRRGLVDRDSIKFTVDLLRQSQTRLVVFAEGRCSFQSDRLMPFQTGGVQLAFQALAKEAKQTGELNNCYAVPIAIRYRYKSLSIWEVVEQTLTELEAELGLQQDGLQQDGKASSESIEQSRYRRLRAVAHAVICQIEADYPTLLSPQLTSDSSPHDNWNPRINQLRTQLLANCETQLGLSINQNQPTRDRAYRIQAALRDAIDAPGNAHADTDANANATNANANLQTELIQKSVERLLNLDAIYDGYVAENPTPERFLDTLARFQREVFGFDEPPPKGIRVARLVVGEPLNLRDWLEDYQRDRSGTVERVTDMIQARVQGKLDELVQAQQAH